MNLTTDQKLQKIVLYNMIYVQFIQNQTRTIVHVMKNIAM